MNNVLQPIRSRLFDRILAMRKDTLPKAARPGAMPIVAVDEITRYMFESTDKDDWDYAKDLPNLAPPWPLFFVETRAPGHIVSARHGTLDMPAEAPSWWGALFAGERTLHGWHVMASMWAEFEGLLTNGPFGHLIMRLDGNGQVAPDDPSAVRFAVPKHVDPSRLPDYASDQLAAMFDPLLLAICFTHCRNVNLYEVAPKERHSRQHMRRHGRKLIRYHILEIEPMRQTLKTEGQLGAVGLKRAVHICRGHFKDYRERGLFGKNKGLYWWDMHVRGTPGEGIVLKDYEVKGPQPSSHT